MNFTYKLLILSTETDPQSISICYTINFLMREEDDMTLPPLPPLARHPSDMLEWRSIAYYNVQFVTESEQTT
jgi:hypothetical protein